MVHAVLAFLCETDEVATVDCRKTERQRERHWTRFVVLFWVTARAKYHRARIIHDDAGWWLFYRPHLADDWIIMAFIIYIYMHASILVYPTTSIPYMTRLFSCRTLGMQMIVFACTHILRIDANAMLYKCMVCSMCNVQTLALFDGRLKFRLCRLPIAAIFEMLFTVVTHEQTDIIPCICICVWRGSYCQWWPID